MGRGRKTRARALTALCGAILAVSLGCAGNGGNGEVDITPEQCRAIIEAAKVAIQECQTIEDLEDRQRCVTYAELGAALAPVGCELLRESEEMSPEEG